MDTYKIASIYEKESKIEVIDNYELEPERIFRAKRTGSNRGRGSLERGSPSGGYGEFSKVL